MKILGFESSCDETGVALVELPGSAPVYSDPSPVGRSPAQPGRDARLPTVVWCLNWRRATHIRRVLPLARQVLHDADCDVRDLGLVAYTRGPGLAGALLVGAGVAVALGAALGVPTLGIPPSGRSPAVAVSGRRPAELPLRCVAGVGRTYPADAGRRGGALCAARARPSTTPPARPSIRAPSCSAWVTRVARRWRGWRHSATPRLTRCRARCCIGTRSTFSFAGLKTAVMTQAKKLGGSNLCEQVRADLAASTQAAIVDVLVAKSLRALRESGPSRAAPAGRRRWCRRPTCCCASGSMPARPPSVGACTIRRWLCVHRQRRDDRAGRRRCGCSTGWPTCAATAPSTVRPRWPLAELAEAT